MTDTNTSTISRVAALAANVAGGKASRAGEPVTANPHDCASSDVGVRFRAHHWNKGYAAAESA